MTTFWDFLVEKNKEYFLFHAIFAFFILGSAFATLFILKLKNKKTELNPPATESEKAIVYYLISGIIGLILSFISWTIALSFFILSTSFSFFYFLKLKNKSNSSTKRSELRATIVALISLVIGLVLCFLAWEEVGSGIHEENHGHIINHFLRDFGLIFIAVALVDFVQKFFMHNNFRKEIIDEIKNITPLYETYHKFGIKAVHDEMPDLKELIREANEVVIVQTYIPSLETYQNDIIDAFKANDNFKLTVYLLNSNSASKPDSAFTAFRSNVIIADPNSDKNKEKIKNGSVEDIIKLKIESNTRTLQSIYDLLIKEGKKCKKCAGTKADKECKDCRKCKEGQSDEENCKEDKKYEERLKYFQYDLLPSASIYRFDEFAYVGFFTYGLLGVNTPQLKLDWTKGIGSTFKNHLDYLMTYPENKVIEIDLTTGSPKVNPG